MLIKPAAWGLQKPTLGTRIDNGKSLAQGLVAAYLMNEGGGNQIFNNVDKQSTASLNSGVTWTTGPFAGTALNFNGTTGVATCSTVHNIPSINNAFSISMWINLISTGGNNCTAIFQGSLNTPQYTFFPGNQGVIFTDGVSNNINIAAPIKPAAGVWNHWVFTLDGNNNYAYYLNGTLKQAAALSFPIGTTVPVTHFSLGARTNSSFYKGAMENVLIYNRVLSPTEVQKLYTQPFTPVARSQFSFPEFNPTTNAIIVRNTRWTRNKPLLGTRINPSHSLSKGLVAAYLFNEAGGKTIFNANDNTQPGMLTGGVTWNNGLFCGGLKFDGSTGYVLLPTTFPTSPTLTYAAWIYFQSGTGSLVVTAAGNYASSWDTAGNRYAFTKATVAVIDSGIAMTPNKWKHAVWTVDTDNIPRLYLDGTLQFTSSNNASLRSANRFNSIGAGNSLSLPPVSFFNGVMDHVLIYNRALSPAEVKQIYAEPFCFMRPIPRNIGGAGIPVFTDSGGSMEWLRTVQKDSGQTLEYLTKIQNDSPAGTEYTATITRDSAMSGEYLLSLSRDGPQGTEYLGTVQADQASLIEWLESVGATIASDNALPIEWQTLYTTPANRTLNPALQVRIFIPSSS